MSKQVAIVEDDEVISMLISRGIKNQTGISADQYSTFAALEKSGKKYDLYVLDNDTGETVQGVNVAKKNPQNSIIYSSDTGLEFDPYFEKTNTSGLLSYIKSFFK